jgi:hypothetical protein
MAGYVLVRHKVRDFSAWKKGFDAHLPKRQEAGLEDMHVLRGASEPNEVFILYKAADMAKAKAFGESPDLRDTMQKAGVVDKPDFYFLNG